MIRRSIFRRLLVAAAAVVGALVLAEVVVCAAERRNDGFFVWPPGLERTFRPSPGVMPGVSGESRFRINALGLRGDEPPAGASPRVLCVGGSTTECLYLDQTEAWPQLVQAELGGAAWVANAGVSGRLTRDHVVQLEHLLPQLGGVDRVVLLVGVNDLMLALGQGDDYEPDFLAREGARRELLPRAFQVLPARLTDRPFPRSTCLWRFFVPRLKAALRPEQVQDEAGAVYSTWRAHRAAAPRLLDELPDLAPALAEYRRNLALLIEGCRAAGARPLLLTQPCLWSADATPEELALFWMGGVGEYQKAPGAAYYSAGALARGMELYNAALIEVASAAGVDCLDLAALLARDTSVFYDDVHFNENGARLVAEHVAAALR